MRIAVSTTWNAGVHAEGEPLLEEILGTGADGVELGYALTHRQADGMADALRDGRIPVTSVHAFCPVPMGAAAGHPELFSICDRFEPLRRRALRAVLDTARFAAEVHAGVVVLHAGRVPVRRAMRKLRDLAEGGRRQEPGYDRQLERVLTLRDRRASKVLERLRGSLRELLPAFESLGLVLALENLPSWDAVPTESEMLRLCEEFPSGTLRYWHDLGHGQIRENLGFVHHESVARRLADCMAGMHVHDVMFPAQDHLMPPCGSLPFERYRDLASRPIPLVLEPAPGTPFERVREAVDFLRSVWS